MIYGKGAQRHQVCFTHHLRLISLAAVVGAAMPVAQWAKAAKSRLIKDPDPHPVAVSFPPGALAISPSVL